MQGVTGVTGAGGIFRTLILNLEQDYDYKPKIPAKLVSRQICLKSGKLAKPECGSSISEYFIEGSQPTESCDAHYVVPFYKNTNKVAFIKLNGKDKLHNIELKNVLILPDIYNRWLEENGNKIPINEIRDYISWINGSFDVAAVPAKVIFPASGSIFAIDPIFDRKYQNLNFRTSLPPNARKVEWYLNEKKIGTNNYPFSYKWNIERGEHQLYIIAHTSDKKVIKSKKIYFTVK
jgi:membrane carboxypeptidase/penicillin-binding protein PbpC